MGIPSVKRGSGGLFFEYVDSAYGHMLREGITGKHWPAWGIYSYRHDAARVHQPEVKWITIADCR